MTYRDTSEMGLSLSHVVRIKLQLGINPYVSYPNIKLHLAAVVRGTMKSSTRQTAVFRRVQESLEACCALKPTILPPEIPEPMKKKVEILRSTILSACENRTVSVSKELRQLGGTFAANFLKCGKQKQFVSCWTWVDVWMRRSFLRFTRYH